MKPPMRLLLVWFLFYGYFLDEGDSAQPPAERTALLRLRGALGVRARDWARRAEPCASWAGVTCRSGRVVSIDLTSLRPRRSARPRLDPDALAALSRLAALNASGFPLPGPIPPALGRLARLTVLDLSRTSLSGPIPAALAGLCNLTHLDLSSNSLSGAVPPALGRLRQLETLILSNNTLSGSLPETLFSGLSRLRSIKLDHNNLSSTLPNSLWALTQLVLLDVSSNNLTGVLLADAVTGNSSAKGGVFNLSNNLFYGLISSEFSRVLKRFSAVDLSSNYFEGNESIGRSTASFALNCFSSASNQRSPADCEKFYMERGLHFVEASSTKSSFGRKRSWHWWYALVAIGCGLVFLAVVVAVLVLCLMKCVTRSPGRKDTGSNPAPSGEAEPPSTSPSPSLPSPVVHLPALGDAFTYEQLLKATSGFSSTNLIRNGHSGDLYHGVLEDGVEVVVKRIDLQAARREAFLTELNFFESVSDARLVPFLGRCLENDNEKLLVYRHMSNGDLSSALHRKPELADDGLRSLDWITRLKIAAGIADALCFLHHESNPPLVHRDVEASSILLDDKYEVQLGSLSEICTQQFDVHQNVLTRILRSSQIPGGGISGSPTATCAYDIYCLGKVLLELVTGKLGISGSNNAVTNKWLEDTQACISIYDKELISKIVDPCLIVDEDHMEEVWAMSVIARSCLDPKPSRRPLARHVLKALENPLKVVREANYSTSSSRGSWYGALVGSWWHSNSSIISVTSKHSGTMRSHRSGEDHSFSQRKMSRDIFPEPDRTSTR